MRRRIARLGLFGDVVASGLLVALTSIVNLASVFVFARGLSPVAFGLFSTCRRVVAFVAPFASLGGHLGVSRYIGYYTTEPLKRSAVLSLAVILTFVVLPVCVLVFGAIELLAGNAGWVAALEGSLWIATAALTATTAAGLVVFSTLRGFGHPQVANSHQLAVLTALLVIGIVCRGAGVARILQLAAATNVSLNAAFLGWALVRHRASWVSPQRSDLSAATSELSRYSLPRLADGPLQASLSLIGVLVAPSIGGLVLSGYIHISQTIVRVTEVLIVPLSVIFLPLVARQVREGKVETLRRQAQLVFDSVLLSSAVLVGQSLAWSQSLLLCVFGSRYEPATPFLMMTLPSILPFLLFAGFRSFIDGYTVRPMNSFHLGISSACVLVLSLGLGRLGGGVGISAAYTAGILVLGALTMRFVIRHFEVRTLTRHTAAALGLGVGSGVLSYPVARACLGRSTFEVFAAFGATVVVASALIVVLGTMLRHPTLVYSRAALGGSRSAPAPCGSEVPPESGFAAAGVGSRLDTPQDQTVGARS